MKPVDGDLRLAKRVRELREAQGLSRVELANRSKIGKTTIQRIEEADGGQTIGALYAVANALGTTVGALLAPDEPLPENDWRMSDAESALLESLMQLSEKHRALEAELEFKNQRLAELSASAPIPKISENSELTDDEAKLLRLYRGAPPERRFEIQRMTGDDDWGHEWRQHMRLMREEGLSPKSKSGSEQSPDQQTSPIARRRKR